MVQKVQLNFLTKTHSQAKKIIFIFLRALLLKMQPFAFRKFKHKKIYFKI